MLPRFTTLLLVLAVGSHIQATQTHKSRPKAATKPAEAAKPAGPPTGPNVLRKGPCVLVLKGTIIRHIPAPPVPKRRNADSPLTRSEPPAQRIPPRVVTEQFNYELPGLLEEETGAEGLVRFKFTPAEDLTAAGARTMLHFEEAATGRPPVVLDATEVGGADKFIFEAPGRGQSLVPKSGLVFMRARVQPAPGAAVSMVAPVQPVTSSPLPIPPRRLGAAPALRFQGLSLWAWANTKDAFTVTSNVDYAAPEGSDATGSIRGSVEISFRIGAPK